MIVDRFKSPLLQKFLSMFIQHRRPWLRRRLPERKSQGGALEDL